MDEKKYFIDQMDKLIKYGRDNNNLVTSKDVREFFKEISLPEEKNQLIYNFLYDAKIGIDEPIDTEENLEEDDRDFLEMYLNELNEIDKVSDDERLVLLSRFLNGEKELQNTIIESYLPEVVETAKMYAGTGVTIEDLIGEGNVALAVMIQNIDTSLSPEDADDFITSSVMTAMEELTYEDNNESQKGTSWADDANSVLDKAKELAETLGRNVTVAELCEFADFEEGFVRDVLNITGGIDIIEG